MPPQVQIEENAWKRTENAVFDEINRCLIHMQIGFLSAARAEVLHAQVIQSIPKRVTKTDTPSLAISLRKDGLFLLINPDFFLHTLKNTEERLAALRHEENHLFLLHPFRMQKFAQQIYLNRLNEHTFDQKESEIEWDPTLFTILADFECNQFISGYTMPSDTIKNDDFLLLSIPKAASVETTYGIMWPLWREMKQHLEEAPHFQNTKNPPKLAELYRLWKHQSHSDHTHWEGEYTINSSGETLHSNINKYEYMLLENELQRILVHAREGLSVEEAKNLPTDMHKQLDGYLMKRNLQYTDPAIAKAAEQEIERILIQFQLKDPFFGQFLLGCARQVTDTLSTAGVALLKKYIVLLVNPTFFMKELRSVKERAGVLKHEALHIILKHIVQMHNPKYSNKRLYNIAADLEVNQYIGAPWKLPDSALDIDKPPFDGMKLPKNDVAEVYYDLLQKEMNSGSDIGKAIETMSQSKQPTGGHSEHGGWGDPNQTGEKSWSPENINRARGFEIGTHEQDIERALQEAKEALGSRMFGKIPGHILSLMNDWAEKRKPAVDWKRELRLFISSNPSTTIKRSSRKKSKRYFHFMRESLQNTPILGDIIRALSRQNSPVLPRISWGDIHHALQAEICTQHPEFTHLEPHQELVLHRLPFFVLYVLQRKHPVQWPTWEDVPASVMHLLDVVRIPMDPDFVPVDIILSLSKQHPHMLTPLTWDDFGLAEKKRIQKQHIHIHEPLWSILPSEELIKLQQKRPDLFQIAWNALPPQFLAQFPFYNFQGPIPFRIDRINKKSIPGLKKERNLPKILVIIDTSGSMSETDIAYVFAEVDKMYSIGCEVHVLQADASPSLYFKYTGTKPLSGRGGTSFDPALQWINDARNGVSIPVMNGDSEPVEEEITLRVDGAIYLTDGCASKPTVQPYCKTLWVLTPNGNDQAIKSSDLSGMIIKLPPYENR